MEIHEGHDLDDDKELKVKIPVDFHVKLHTLKVLHGQNISSTVEQALTRYFDRLSEDPDGERLEELSTQTLESLSLNRDPSEGATGTP